MIRNQRMCWKTGRTGMLERKSIQPQRRNSSLEGAFQSRMKKSARKTMQMAKSARSRMATVASERGASVSTAKTIST